MHQKPTQTSTPIIKVTDLGKKYPRYQNSDQPYLTLRDQLSLKSNQKTTSSDKKNEFWALQGLNFSVQPGEKVAIIGANGAGKSTLLKLLSRITLPTTGQIELNGQVASLLEVGSGFNGELTGRENIYLNGAILGMSKKEIDQKYNQIVDFAEVADFIDTPYKHYSSGMSMRLAFAVAAFLEPEILLVDEVLAVGDMAFQRKSLQKMKDISQKDGKTILFVSHDLGAVSSLCERGIFIEKGQIVYDGPIEKAIEKYLLSRTELKDQDQLPYQVDLLSHPAKKDAHEGIQKAEIRVNGHKTHFFKTGDTLELRLYYHNSKVYQEPQLGLVLKNSLQQPILGFNNQMFNFSINEKKKSGWIQITFPKFLLYGEGQFFFDIYYGNRGTDWEVIPDAFYLEVQKNNYHQAVQLLKPQLNIFAPEVIYEQTD